MWREALGLEMWTGRPWRMLRIVTLIHTHNLNQPSVFSLKALSVIKGHPVKLCWGTMLISILSILKKTGLVLLWNVLCRMLLRYLFSKVFQSQHSLNSYLLFVIDVLMHSSHCGFLLFIYFFHQRHSAFSLQGFIGCLSHSRNWRFRILWEVQFFCHFNC